MYTSDIRRKLINETMAAVHVVESWDISDVVLPPPLDTTWWRVDDRLLVPAPALLATAKQDFCL
ncbi:UNVERIFIED_CONTAM: hypothetical protein NCL1_07149 [Trichonephila clavipes]